MPLFDGVHLLDDPWLSFGALAARGWEMAVRLFWSRAGGGLLQKRPPQAAAAKRPMTWARWQCELTPKQSYRRRPHNHIEQAIASERCARLRTTPSRCSMNKLTLSANAQSPITPLPSLPRHMQSQLSMARLSKWHASTDVSTRRSAAK